MVSIMTNSLDSGHPVDVGSEESPLSIACFWGHEDAARSLLQAGASLSLNMRTGAFDPSIVNDPLSCAVSGGQNNTMRLLLAKGAELEAVSGDPSRMAFEQAMDSIKPFDDLDALPLCMAYGPGFHKSSNQLGSMPSTGALGSTNAATTDCLVDIIANSVMFDISMFWGNSLCLAALCSNFYAMRYL